MTEPAGGPVGPTEPSNDVGTPESASTSTTTGSSAMTGSSDATAITATEASSGLPGPGVDLGRRGFFRAFATELIQGAATVAGHPPGALYDERQ